MSGRIISFLRRKATKPPKFSLDIPVCDTVPQIHILGHPASFSFIIDTTKIELQIESIEKEINGISSLLDDAVQGSKAHSLNALNVGRSLLLTVFW